jgi:hypothetical protein
LTCDAHSGLVLLSLLHDGSPERDNDVTFQLRALAILQIRMPTKPEPPQTSNDLEVDEAAMWIGLSGELLFPSINNGDN